MTQALKHLLPPTREQLANVRGMEEFIRSICEYITPNNPMSEPNNVAIMYRAFLEAMRYEGLSCPQDEAKLTFVFRGQRYLVNFKSVFANIKKEETGTPICQANLTIERCQLLLRKVQDSLNAEIATMAHRIEQPPMSVDDAAAQALTEPPRADRILCVLRQLKSSEQEAGQSSHKVNTAYYSLGKLYREVTHEDRAARVLDICTSDFHKAAFPGFLRLTSEKFELIGLAGIKKRMERARKFVGLVDMFGDTILAMVDVINVIQVDKITFKMLLTLRKELNHLTVRLRMEIENRRKQRMATKTSKTTRRDGRIRVYIQKKAL